MRSLLLIASIAGIALAVCAIHGTAQEQEPKTARAQLSESEKAAVEKFFSLKIEEVKKHMGKHNYQYAISLIDAILIVHPKTHHVRELKRLRTRASEALLQQDVVRVYLYSPKNIYAFGEKIELKLRAKNISEEEIVFPHTDEKARNFGILVKKAYEYEFLGSRRMQRTQTVVKQDAPIALRKDEIWEKSFEIEPPRRARAGDSVCRYVFKASLRPAEIITGEEEFSRFLPTGELEIWVMPKEHLNLSGNAFAHLEEAASHLLGRPSPGELAIKSIRAALKVVFYSAFFLNNEEKKQAIDLLVPSLEKLQGDSARAIMGSLSYLTGKSFGSSGEQWIKWWKRGNKE